jgi:eukaryotic-like serine/threonine-protein kinase
MGEVYRAGDTRLGREVAIKVLPAERMHDEARRRRFVQEAQAASALNHPNIVTIHEIESANDIDFIVMEYVRGSSLDTRIPRQGFRLNELLRIAIPVADALAAAHARGIVHRDLKPANVMIGDSGVVKVLDFGLAKLVADDDISRSGGTATATQVASVGLSIPGAILGTAAYMAPEQASGGKVDTRSDVFSFGAMLYEMATGAEAFSGSSVADTLAAVIRDQPAPPSQIVDGVPRELERVILRCLRKDPERRYQTIADVRNELQEIKEESASGPPGVAPVSMRPGRRRGILLSGLGLAAAGVAVTLYLRHPPPPPPVPPMRLFPVTSLSGTEIGAKLSPDGEQVVFAWDNNPDNYRIGFDRLDIYLKLVSSPDVRRLTNDAPGFTWPGGWSPDGGEIVYYHTTATCPDCGDRVGTISLISTATGAVRKLLTFPALGPRFGRTTATACSPAPWHPRLKALAFTTFPSTARRPA